MSLDSQFKIIDTLRWNKKQGFIYKDLHIQRTWDAFQFFKILPNLKRFELVENYDQLESQNLSGDESKIRLSFETTDSLNYKHEVFKLESVKAPIHLQVLDALSLPIGIGKNTFKTDDRQQWNLLLNFKSPKADDVVSINTDGNLVESSRFNLFFYDQPQNACYTPTLESGCLRGVFRDKCLKDKSIFLPDLNRKVQLIEKNIPILMGKKLSVYVGNSVRDALPATFI